MSYWPALYLVRHWSTEPRDDPSGGSSMPAIHGCIWLFAAGANRDERPETVFCDANFSSFRTEAALQAVASPARAAIEQALHVMETGVAGWLPLLG